MRSLWIWAYRFKREGIYCLWKFLNCVTKFFPPVELYQIKLQYFLRADITGDFRRTRFGVKFEIFGKLHFKIILIWEEKLDKKNSVTLVRERNIPTERPLIVREVSANVLRIEGAT
jgi:hypothetical protein